MSGWKLPKASRNGLSLCCGHREVSSVLFGITLTIVAASAIVQPYAQPQVSLVLLESSHDFLPDQSNM